MNILTQFLGSLGISKKWMNENMSLIYDMFLESAKMPTDCSEDFSLRINDIVDKSIVNVRNEELMEDSKNVSIYERKLILTGMNISYAMSSLAYMTGSNKTKDDLDKTHEEELSLYDSMNVSVDEVNRMNRELARITNESETVSDVLTKIIDVLSKNGDFNIKTRIAVFSYAVGRLIQKNNE